MTPEQEAAAVANAQSDPEKFTVLYDAHIGRVYRYFMLRTGHKETAEDLTSQTFLQAFSGLPKYENRGAPFAAWLFRIAHNILVNNYRKPQALSLELAENMPGGEDVKEQVERRLALQELKQIIEQLPETDQEIVMLRTSADLSFAEIAQTLETTEGAARTAYHRAVKKMISLQAGQKSYDSQLQPGRATP